jgi:hypothetical protein
MWLVQVELPWACFGFEVTSDGWVIQAAPIPAWTVGKRGRDVVTHYRQRSGRVGWQQVPHWLSYAGHPLTGITTELHAAVDQLDAGTVPESYYQKVLANSPIRRPRCGSCCCRRRPSGCPPSSPKSTPAWRTSGSSRRGGRCSTVAWAARRCRSTRCCGCCT